MTNKTFNKIFCIGMNKTGTSSLHQAFLKLGLRSIHHGPGDYSSLREHLQKASAIDAQIREFKKSGEKLLQEINDYDAYSDIGLLIHNFHIIDSQYPNSKFIYTQRNTDDWVNSRRKHIERNIKARESGRYESAFNTVEVETWIKTKNEHFARVKSYFRNRPNDLLIMHVTEGDGFEKLCPFLGLTIPEENFPRANVAKGFSSNTN